ncbi:MAG: hypothetical protein ACFFDI_09665 [Promethearchaeota archaeon]
MIQQENSVIWSKWIISFSFIIIVAGFCLSFVYPFLFPQMTEPFLIEITGMTFSELTSGHVKFYNLLSGIIGGTMIGWGIILMFLGYRLMKQPEDWIWTAITISLILWYAFDTLTSILAGSSLNVILNSIFLIIALPPLIANRNNIIKGLKA